MLYRKSDLANSVSYERYLESALALLRLLVTHCFISAALSIRVFATVLVDSDGFVAEPVKRAAWTIPKRRKSMSRSDAGDSW